MAKQEAIIEVDIQGTEKVESMRTQMRKLREELARLPEGTEEFKRVQAQLGELKDKMDDLGKSVNTMTGDPLERLNNSFSMIGSSILSLDFGQALTGINGVTAAMKAFKFADLSKAAKGFGSAMLDMGKTLLLNPIFLIGSVIVLIITNFEKLTKAGGLVGKVFSAIGDAIGWATSKVTEFLDWIGLTDSKQEERLAAETKRKEEEAKLLEENLKKQKEAEEKAAEEQKRREEKAAQEAQQRREKARAAAEAAAKKTKEDQQSLSDFIKNEEEKRTQIKLTEQEKDLRQLELNYQKQRELAHGNKQLLAQLDAEFKLQEAAINKKYADEEGQKRLEKEREIQKLLQEIKIEQIAEEEALAQEIQNIRQGTKATELQNVQDEYFVKIEAAKKLGLDSLVLEEELKKKQGEINDKYRKEEEQKEKELQDAKYELAKIAVEGMMSLNNLLTETGILNAEQSFKVGKALSIAQTTISTIMGVQNALSAATTIPEPFGSALKIANAVSIGLAGASNIAKIAATKFNKGGGGSSGGGATTPSGGGGGGMGAGSTNAPALDLSFVNNQTNKPQPLQTYVLATNVSNAQEAEEKIKDQSRIIK